jgi:hypothetical protein
MMPIYISPPAKVKRLGVVKSIIANVFTESGDIINLEQLIYNRTKGNVESITPNQFRVLLFKSNNGQPYDYDLTIVNPNAAVVAAGLDQKDYQNGEPVDWATILDVQGGYTAHSQTFFKQATGYDIVGTFAVNTIDPSILVVTLDQDTVPQNTAIASTISGIAARGTIDAIIDPLKYNPITVYGSRASIPLGLRFLMLDDVNPSPNVGLSYNRQGDSSSTAYDGPDAWKNSDGNDAVINANSIIEWNGSRWISVWEPATGTEPTYIQNLKTGIKYRWDGEQWLKAFEGEYAPGYWGFVLDPQ